MASYIIKKISYNINSLNYYLCFHKNVLREDANIILSPASVRQCLLVAALSSCGPTASEIRFALGFEPDLPKKALLSDLKLLSKGSLTSTRMYVNHNHGLNENLQMLIEKQIGYAIAESVNFTDHFNTTSTINEWISNQTNQKITNLLDSSEINSDTEIVLINAIYFKDTWQHQFPKDRSFLSDFYLTETESQLVEFMQMKTDLKFNRFLELDTSCLELPYKTPNVSMYLFLPNKRNGLKDLLEKVLIIDIKMEVFDKLIEQKVEVTLPKFKLDFNANLNNALKNMGIKTMFSNAADFNELLTTKFPIKVSSVAHAAAIEVNEEGVVAAASTGNLKLMFIFLGKVYFFFAQI